MEKYICIHGHFYQPPRENPWLEHVEQQDSAYPFHDWNERITYECYAPNMASRMLDNSGRIVDIVNNYSRISFNFGPTLLSWLERHRPEVYEAVLLADRKSMELYSGHGAALAQVYNHMIMPLANARDKRTQILWGIRDFEERFKRFPEGMWLPETAVDLATLEELAACGIKFTVLAPHQAKRTRKTGRGGRWQDVTGGRINPTVPYLCRLPSGKSISLFFYDGPISQAIAFEGLLSNGEHFAKRLLGAIDPESSEPQLIHIATDGETYGHHHRYGEMALTYCLHFIDKEESVRPTIYGEFLAKHPPAHEAEIYENTSWSCVHGIGRWKENCGCHSGTHPGWTQEWRGPLREALDFLRDELLPVYEEGISAFIGDPWRARNEYIDVVLNRDQERIQQFIDKHSRRTLTETEVSRCLKLLELQRNAMLMYTSCGWFFDEISGIESMQVLLYAARVMQIAEDLGIQGLEETFMGILERAPSNLYPNGSTVYEKHIKPSRVDLLRVGAHYAVSSLFEKYPENARIYCYNVQIETSERLEAGKLKLATGRARIVSDLTLIKCRIGYAVIHLGDHNLYAGIKDYPEKEEFDLMQAEIKSAFEKVDVPEVIRLLEKYFGSHSYSLWHLFRDDQRKIIDRSQILRQPLQNAEAFYRQVVENNYPTLNYLRGLQIPIPKPLLVALEFTINADLKRLFDTGSPDIDKFGYLLNEANKWKIEIDRETLSYVVSAWLNEKMSGFRDKPDDYELMDLIEKILGKLRSSSVGWDYWKLQNDYYDICKGYGSEMISGKDEGDESAIRWVELFRKVGNHLGMAIEC